MSCLWTCLSLLYAAAFLQSSASSNKGVSLECSKTVEVRAGETATINCTIKHSEEQGCKVVRYLWRDNNDSIPCNSGLMKYNCEWDNLTYVALTISNVMGETNYTIYIETDCGMAESSVKIHAERAYRKPKPPQGLGKGPERHVIPVVLAVAGTLIVSGVLFFRYGRKTIKRVKKRKTRANHSDADTAPSGGSPIPA